MKKILFAVSLLFAGFSLNAQKHIEWDVRYAHHPEDFKKYETEKIRKDFLIEKVFEKDMIHMTYTMYDRFIVGGAMPVNKELALDTIDILKAPNFLHRREIGIINIGGDGIVKVGKKSYTVKNKEALYVGAGDHEVVFASKDAKNPAKFYFNSATAHKAFPTKLITLKDANVIEAGSAAESNRRTINQLIVKETVDVCQVQMGMTMLHEGSVWNTMPAHTHNRRMEAYLYFDLPANQAVCHFMGEPQQTRHIWMQNEQAAISPEWSIHSGAATSNYTFIWGMAGENLDYNDMDKFAPDQLR
ncbi:5-dehydro-4-deoxy-D-glucuronate isomerase [Bacteroides propionicifaciens]|uniref:5-dehydro-4-deoxy-D-glucuronate isomerase n=1 Tax=Bacteroides propionicifaciens TaxID=392838 RepID=UPI00038277AD|nr:5-dehydro-4-deoxy-D-glucuronate isomerase [Bacteroides propionicifaciens]